MERRDCQVIVYFVIALAASLGLGLAIAYLEVKRSQEIVSIEIKWFQEIQKMQKEVDDLKEELRNKTSMLSESINNLPQSPPPGEEDYYYDEEYDEEEDEEEGGGKETGGKGKEGGKEGGKRSRREVRYHPAALTPYNLILRQYKTSPQHNYTSPEVKARIFVKADQPQGFEFDKPSYGTPQKQHTSLGNGVAIHYVGDTSKVRHPGRHGYRCYDANHRMCHVRGIIKDWAPAPGIMDTMSMGGYDISTMRDGELTLNKYPGIYYFYSQIFYADNHDMNGYRVYVNGDPVFQCSLTNLHHDSWIPNRVPHKKNSCFTGGLIHLKEGDRITIREVDNVERYSVFEPYKSFFGLFQVISLPSSRS